MDNRMEVGKGASCTRKRIWGGPEPAVVTEPEK